MNPGKSAVIFDMDGTLTRAVLDFDQIRAEIGIVGETILEALAKMDADARRRADEIVARHERDAATGSELQPFAKECLRALRNAGIPVALMTRNSRKSVETVLARHNLVFDHIRTREDGPFKPSPEPVHDICQLLGVPPQNAWVVGDFRYDLECGRAAGARTILFIESGQVPDWACLADTIVRDLRDIPSLVGVAFNPKIDVKKYAP